jgi:phage tail sheath protein FI
MAVQVSYPGVYIEEFAPGAPIQGVSTSIAAFIGAAREGRFDEPTKITSWDQFVQRFGSQPLAGPFYLWYAVRGFFENGGQVCYIVRASNGTYASLGDPTNPATGAPLFNRAATPEPFAKVFARRPGNLVPPIQVAVTGVNLVPNTTQLFKPSGGFTRTGTREITLAQDDAAKFRPGDYVNLGAAMPRVRVVRTTILTLLLDSDVPGTIASGTLVLANTEQGIQTVRVVATDPTLGAALEEDALTTGTMLTLGAGTPQAESHIVDSVQVEQIRTTPPADPITTYRVTFRDGLVNQYNLDPASGDEPTVQSEEFTFDVSQDSSVTSYQDLSIDPAHPRYFPRIVNAGNGPVEVELIEDPLPTAQPPDNMPANLAATPLLGGVNENLSEMRANDYIDALDQLRLIDEVSLVAIPDSTEAAVQQAMIAHCELTGDRFAVLDSMPGLDSFGTADPDIDGVDEQRKLVDSTRGYAALYYPWIYVRRPGVDAPLLVPPSGHVCGVVARTDLNRGVFKAPANEYVNGAVDIQHNAYMSDPEHGQLNLQGINVIRVPFGGGRPLLMGARTTATDRNWQYVNIRRLFLFLEESIQEGIKWAVFEPNNIELWQKLKRTISAFLGQQWRNGALFGATEEEAFYVRIDEALNPFSERALGRLYIEIGINPTYPAEFIIVRIGIWDGGSEVTEV